MKLDDDILTAHPPGKLPDKMIQRWEEEINAVLQESLKIGGRHLYTIAYHRELAGG